MSETAGLNQPHEPRPGDRIGPYEIVEEVGRGGMGVVYRGREPRLGLEVALKCPRPDSLARPGTRERFLKEARMAARLSHSHIVPIHGVLEEGGRPWLAMAWVEGRSLRRLLDEDGPVPPPQAVRWAGQIAQALAAAHRRHVLHRDITPGNIFIDESGDALLGDFGLATFHAEPGEASEATTAEPPLTGSGAIVGTRGYMSPEQSLGRPLDARTDIFSLGAVLHEMLTGRPAFAGSSQAETLDAILNRQPDRLRPSGRRSIDAHLERILRRCLAKRPEDRFAAAADLAAELGRLRLQMEGTPPPGRLRAWSLAAALLAAAVAVPVMWALLRERPAPPTAGPVQASVTPVVTWAGAETEARFSPDGQWITFITDRDGRGQVWVRRVGSGEPVPLTGGVDPVVSHSWSPDGSELACLVERPGAGNALEMVPAPLGGPARLRHPVDAPVRRIVRWRRDGIYLEGDERLWRLEPAAGTVVEVPLELEGLEFHHHYDISSTGGRVVLSAAREGKENLWRGGLAGEPFGPLLQDPFTARWPLWLDAADGRVVYTSNRSGESGLWIVGPASAEPTRLPLGRPVHRAHDWDAAAGRLAVEVLHDQSDLWLVPGDGSRSRPLTSDSLQDLSPAVGSRDGTVLFQRAWANPRTGLSLFDAGLQEARLEPDGRLTGARPVTRDGFAPLPSPDGRWVAFLRYVPQPPTYTELWVLDRNTRKEHRIAPDHHIVGAHPFPSELVAANLAWSASGDALLHVRRHDDGSTGLHRHRPEAPAEEQPPLHRLPADALGLTDPRPHQRDGTVAVLAHGPSASGEDSHRVLVLDPAGGRADTWLEAPAEGGTAWRLAGWLADDMLLLLELRPTPGPGRLLMALGVTADGGRQELGRVAGALPGTARLDRPRRRLLVTAADDTDIHNVLALDLDRGAASILTHNEQPRVTFSGLAALADGSLCAARQHENSDIWLVELRPGPEEGR